MIELHKLMLGPEVRFDHNTLLSRRDFVGQHWHSHGYVEDNAGVTTRPGGAKLRLVRSLVYPGKKKTPLLSNLYLKMIILPRHARDKYRENSQRRRFLTEGFQAHDDGGLKVVPGAHLYRSTTLREGGENEYDRKAAPGEADDAYFEETWLKGKTHPITGQPLEIMHLDLPPGSMAVCLCHTPHGVCPRPKGTGTRHCTLFSYREPDPQGKAEVSTNMGLQPWELERDAALGKYRHVAPGPVNLFSLW